MNEIKTDKQTIGACGLYCGLAGNTAWANAFGAAMQLKRMGYHMEKI